MARDLREWLVSLAHQTGIILTGAVLTLVTLALGQIPEDRYVPGWVWIALAFLTISAAQFRVWRQSRNEAHTLQETASAEEARRDRLASSRVLQGETFWVHELLGFDARRQAESPKVTVENRRFEDCVLVGPALLVFQVHYDMSSCKWIGGPREGMFWPLTESRYIQGQVTFVNCEFERCTFVWMGLAGSEEELQYYKDMPEV